MESGDAPDGSTVADLDGVIDLEPPIEPGSPTLENAAFVLLGVFVALAVIARLVLLFG